MTAYDGSSVAVSPPNDPYTNLAHGIVIKAVDDYRAALRKLKKNPENRDAQARKKECEAFFRSDWCKFLTNVDMVNAAKYIRQEVLKE